MKQPTFGKTPPRPQPTPMQPPMRIPARMPVQQPQMRMPVQPARPQPSFQPAPRPAPPPPPRQPMQQARPMQQPMQQPSRMQGMLTGTPAPAQQQQPQDFQAFRQRSVDQLTPQQQQVYQDASRMGGNIDPLAVAMGGPNALQQARQMQMQMQGQPMQGLRPDRMPVTESAEMQGLRQRMESQAPRGMSQQNGMMVPDDSRTLYQNGDIMERLMQLLQGRQ